MYEVNFANGYKHAMAANVIVENMFASIDEDGHKHLLLDYIIDSWKSGDDVRKEDAFLQSHNGTIRCKEINIGWEILIQRKDRSNSWSKIKDVKYSYPVEIAEFLVHNKINEEAAFAWW